ncbi:MAG: methylthioribose-1-phosphate isomerase [Spirochaetes bacterium]|nr:MAG: methylthioribose-1-phosphate isomerase [Spirochaetota bacterium]
MTLKFEPVRLDDGAGALVVLDQTLLPSQTHYLRLCTLEEIWEAIRQLRVRGAPAIGIAAAYGAYLALRNNPDWGQGARPGWPAEVDSLFAAAKNRLANSRPTAVNLFWALDRMEGRLNALRSEAAGGASAGTAWRAAILAVLRDEAHAIRNEDEAACRSIGEHGLSLLKKGWGLLTHCNAGALATARYGTALAPIYLGQERGYGFKVFAGETRPLLQGARLTAWELGQAGVDLTLICDNMSSIVMKSGKVQAVLVGCDRVAANGDSANKIGTSGLAVLAAHYDIPFYIHAPLSTVDLACATGADIRIEERPPEEVTEAWYAKPMAPRGVKVYNPAFDVTDASLIGAIITERGIAYPPYGESLGRLSRA